MSSIQKFFIRLLPKKWAEDMEAHSRSWIVRCGKCGFEQSIWDMGGIRWRAVGNSRTYLRCRHCGKRSWHKLSRRPASEKR
jgi:ribosomal protein S27E